MSTVRKGVRFRSVIADCNALWEVTTRACPGVWYARVVDEPYVLPDGTTIPSDWAGTTKTFMTDEIERAVAWAANVAAHMARQDDWWANVPIGSTVHYCNGWDEWVRGTVAVLDATNSEATHQYGKRGLVPTALVGAWPKYHREHHERKVLSGRGGWQPNVSCVYEAPECVQKYRRGVDPRTLSPIPLEAA